MNIENMILVGFAFALGGMLKGATGAGTPLLAVPIVALLYDVPTAVALLIFPNIASNAVQLWQNRSEPVNRYFLYAFAGASALGAAIGTVALAKISGDALLLYVAIVVLFFVAFRLLKPTWRLSHKAANRLVLPIGSLAGGLQGAVGISGPVSISFLNALRLERPKFVLIISLSFIAIALVQLPMQVHFGIMTWERAQLSVLALVPMGVGMPIGSAIGRRFSAKTFDRIILFILFTLSVKMIFEFLF